MCLKCGYVVRLCVNLLLGSRRSDVATRERRMGCRLAIVNQLVKGRQRVGPQADENLTLCTEKLLFKPVDGRTLTSFVYVYNFCCPVKRVKASTAIKSHLAWIIYADCFRFEKAHVFIICPSMCEEHHYANVARLPCPLTTIQTYRVPISGLTPKLPKRVILQYVCSPVLTPKVHYLLCSSSLLGSCSLFCLLVLQCFPKSFANKLTLTRFD